MKNRIVKKILRIILLVLVGAAVIGTFYFLWKKAQPVITVYEIVTLKKGCGNQDGRYRKRRASFRGGDQAADFRYHLRAEERSGADGPSGRDYRHYQGNPRDGTAQQRRIGA